MCLEQRDEKIILCLSQAACAQFQHMCRCGVRLYQNELIQSYVCCWSVLSNHKFSKRQFCIKLFFQLVHKNETLPRVTETSVMQRLPTHPS